jgi:hypothetical protein
MFWHRGGCSHAISSQALKRGFVMHSRSKEAQVCGADGNIHNQARHGAV